MPKWCKKSIDYQRKYPVLGKIKFKVNFPNENWFKTHKNYAQNCNFKTYQTKVLLC